MYRNQHTAETAAAAGLPPERTTDIAAFASKYPEAAAALDFVVEYAFQLAEMDTTPQLEDAIVVTREDIRDYFLGEWDFADLAIAQELIKAHPVVDMDAVVRMQDSYREERGVKTGSARYPTEAEIDALEDYFDYIDRLKVTVRN